METKKRQPTCEERVDAHMEDRLQDLRKLWTAYCEGDEDRHSDDLGNFHEYGLCFDYVTPEAGEPASEGFFRYQLSTGGPGDEFRFFCGPGFEAYRVEYRFLDWWDGAGRTLTGDDLALLLEIWESWKDCEVPQHAFKEATE